MHRYRSARGIDDSDELSTAFPSIPSFVIDETQGYRHQGLDQDEGRHQEMDETALRHLKLHQNGLLHKNLNERKSCHAKTDAQPWATVLNHDPTWHQVLNHDPTWLPGRESLKIRNSFSIPSKLSCMDGVGGCHGSDEGEGDFSSVISDRPQGIESMGRAESLKRYIERTSSDISQYEKVFGQNHNRNLKVVIHRTLSDDLNIGEISHHKLSNKTLTNLPYRGCCCGGRGSHVRLLARQDNAATSAKLKKTVNVTADSGISHRQNAERATFPEYKNLHEGGNGNMLPCSFNINEDLDEQAQQIVNNQSVGKLTKNNKKNNKNKITKENEEAVRCSKSKNARNALCQHHLYKDERRRRKHECVHLEHDLAQSKTPSVDFRPGVREIPEISTGFASPSCTAIQVEQRPLASRIPRGESNSLPPSSNCQDTDLSSNEESSFESQLRKHVIFLVVLSLVVSIAVVIAVIIMTKALSIDQLM